MRPFLYYYIDETKTSLSKFTTTNSLYPLQNHKQPISQTISHQTHSTPPHPPLKLLFFKATNPFLHTMQHKTPLPPIKPKAAFSIQNRSSTPLVTMTTVPILCGHYEHEEGTSLKIPSTSLKISSPQEAV